MKINEILKQQKEMPVQIQGKIINVYQRKERDTQYGKKSSQTAILQDDTGTIALSFKDVPDVGHLLNKTISAQCSSTAHGLKGCLKDEYTGEDGTLKHVIKITKMAHLDGASIAIDAPKAPQTHTNAPKTDDHPKNGGNGHDVIPASMIQSYKKDMWAALIQNGVDPDEATNIAIRCYEKLYNNQLMLPKNESAEQMAKRLFEGDAQE